MTYGCQTWSLNKQLTNKLRTAQRAMERKRLGLKLQDKISRSEIRKRTKIIDMVQYTLKQKWRWAGHKARRTIGGLNAAQSGNQGEGRNLEDDQQKMARRHNKEGGNHLKQESNRQKTVEDTDGGLHPAVDGHSLGERCKFIFWLQWSKSSVPAVACLSIINAGRTRILNVRFV